MQHILVLLIITKNVPERYYHNSPRAGKVLFNILSAKGWMIVSEVKFYAEFYEIFLTKIVLAVLQRFKS